MIIHGLTGVFDHSGIKCNVFGLYNTEDHGNVTQKEVNLFFNKILIMLNSNVIIVFHFHLWIFCMGLIEDISWEKLIIVSWAKMYI